MPLPPPIPDPKKGLGDSRPEAPEHEWHDELHIPPQPILHRRIRHWLVLSLITVSLALWNLFPIRPWTPKNVGTAVAHCPQESPLVPASHLLPVLEDIYATEAFRNLSALWLSGAVQIPTESYDYLPPVGDHPHWDIFATFNAYLHVSFPKTFATARITVVNTYNIVMHLEGSDHSLKPILLTAHQDVVPVEPSTVPLWKYPPYSGHYDGEFVYGRGSVDDKSGLIGILASLETLLETGFAPRRTIVAAFGIDEEASTKEGAAKLATYLEETYGLDGFALLVDEGFDIIEEKGVLVATPEVSEKGRLNVRVLISTPGGHSAVPPAHTSIGLLALAIELLEANPHKPHLSRSSPFYDTVVCVAEHAPDMPKELKTLVLESLHSEPALRQLENSLLNGRDGKRIRSLLSTTQAVDLVEGGTKANALPEKTSTVVNHRISVESSVGELKAHLTRLFTQFAREHNLTLIAFGNGINNAPDWPASGTFELSSAWDGGLEPAPITPTNSSAYRLLSGSILATHAKSVVRDGAEEMIVAPTLPGGNTDTQFYWGLTQHLFRYNHINLVGLPNRGGLHTINEAIPIASFVDNVRFFTILIMNADESNDLS